MSTHSDPYYTPEDPCPFCLIASRHPPIPSLLDLSTTCTNKDPERPFLTHKGDAHLIISTPTVLAFMDIMPRTRGHVLVIPREHRVNLAEMRPTEMMFVGAWLPVVARAVVKVTGWRDFNIVQNNGVSASQVIFHTHFHIVPRQPLGPSLSEAAQSPATSYGFRDSDLDDQEGADMAREIRREIVNELRKLEEKKRMGGKKKDRDEEIEVGGGEEIVLALL